MNLRKIFNIFLIIIISVTALGYDADVFAASTSSEASASAEASKRKKSRKKKRKKTTRKKKRRKTTRKVVPQEQILNDSLTLSINRAVIDWVKPEINPGGLRVNSVKPNKTQRVATIGLNENFTHIEVTKDLIDSLKMVVTRALPDSIRDYGVVLNVGKRSLAYYINTVDKLPIEYRCNKPFVWAKDQYASTALGMQGDIVALWHSHGRYYKSGGWYWQRPLLFETAEDVFTMSYILNYLTPMLENAGAYVFLPRERDVNRHEVIIDNDLNEGGDLFSQPYYRELIGTKPWENGSGEGFIYDLKDFRDTENPFEVGTYRQTTTVMSGKPSVAAWYADIPKDGDYAVYVSYKTVENSSKDALYTVYYSGGSRQFTVDQTMGGGTWIYLGTFPMEEGYSDVEPVVTLSNLSTKSGGKIVTADAVKIGGGMGNISRSTRRSDVFYDPSTPLENDQSLELTEQTTTEENSTTTEENSTIEEQIIEEEIEEVEEDNVVDEVATVDTIATSSPQVVEVPKSEAVFKMSGYPRYLEGARYWLHWAGFPESVYSPYGGADDYKDDYTSRALWVNYLAGGSRVLPDREGLNIPVDLAFALHSDAGKRADDSIVGTLGICYTNNGASYKDGTPRSNSRVLTDMIMRQVTTDIRRQVEPQWKRRSLWDKSYVEARVPEVPTTLLELLSHQNFGDMQYGLDPRFQFIVGRSIYKAMARFMAERKDRELVIQPLPVKSFAIHRVGKGKYRLSWQATIDSLEPTAKPDKYIIFERNGETLGFNKIGESKNTYFDIKIKDNDVHSFKVVAANEGGMSFPSEILALRENEDGRRPILIVNGFTRVCGPASFVDGSNAGFKSEEDFGVPYIRTFSFSGHQIEFRRGAGDNFGKSSDSYITSIIAGNTFDFVAMHGQSIADAGYGFISASIEAVANGTIRLTDYKTVDLILGKQKETLLGKGSSGWEFKTFPPKVKKSITEFLNGGGDIFISGQYVASDMSSNRSSDDDMNFISNQLGFTLSVADNIKNPRIDVVSSKVSSDILNDRYRYSNTLNEDFYIVEKPDVIAPNASVGATALMKFVDTDQCAAILKEQGQSKCIVMTIPFESIIDIEQRNRLMMEVLNYFDN